MIVTTEMKQCFTMADGIIGSISVNDHLCCMLLKLDLTVVVVAKISAFADHQVVPE